MIIQNKDNSQIDFRVEDDRYLLVGLGNIGDKYAKTRHNAGFMVIDRILELNNVDPAREDKSFFGLFQRFTYDNYKFYVLKPTTFMNDSGRAVKAVMKYYDLIKENLILIHDDLDIDFGKYKINLGKGPREHNGIKSVESYLASDDFWRVRIGIEARDPEIRHKFKGRDYVLSRFSKDEQENLKEMSVDIWDDIQNKILTS